MSRLTVVPTPTPRPSALSRPFLRSEGSGGETFDIDVALDLVVQHRNLTCPFYDSCLSTAASQGWMGWSCRDCDLRFTEGGPR